MFAWLLRWFGAPSGARAETRRSSAQRATASRPTAAKGDTSSEFFDSLTREVQKAPPLSGREQQETTALVERVTGYVREHAIEPPVVPALAAQMLELLRKPDIEVQDLTRLVERDQATAAKILSISNSALYRGHNEIATLRDAVVFLGTEQAAQIAIVLATRTMFEGSPQRDIAGPRWSRLFTHAMTTAFAACQLVTLRSRRHSETAFLGGLFHDVGKAVALRAVSDMLQHERAAPVSDVVLDAALQLIHAEPTSILYDGWKLPQSLMAICRTHHRLGAEAARELHFVRLVSGLDTLQNGAEVDRHEALEEVAESASALRMADPELRAAATQTKEYRERVLRMFS